MRGVSLVSRFHQTRKYKSRVYENHSVLNKRKFHWVKWVLDDKIRVWKGTYPVNLAWRVHPDTLLKTIVKCGFNEHSFSILMNELNVLETEGLTGLGFTRRAAAVSCQLRNLLLLHFLLITETVPLIFHIHNTKEWERERNNEKKQFSLICGGLNARRFRFSESHCCLWNWESPRGWSGISVFG